jgi:hypothetical protein
MAKGWISLHRRFLDWEWYDDNNTMKLFIHLLLKANHKKKNWKGITIIKGQVLTGRKQLSFETKLSEQQIRTSLNKLKSTNEITIKTTNLYSLVSITNWNKYQGNNQPITNEQPTSNQQVTTTNNENNENNENNILGKSLKNFQEIKKETLEAFSFIEQLQRESKQSQKKVLEFINKCFDEFEVCDDICRTRKDYRTHILNKIKKEKDDTPETLNEQFINRPKGKHALKI